MQREVDAVKAQVKANAQAVALAAEAAPMKMIESNSIRAGAPGIDRALLRDLAGRDLSKERVLLIQHSSGALVPADDRSAAVVAAARLQGGRVRASIVKPQGVAAIAAQERPPYKSPKEFGKDLHAALKSNDPAAIREAMRAWHRSDGRPVSADVNNMRGSASEFSTATATERPTLAHADAFHEFNGNLVLAKRHEHVLREGARALAEGRPLTRQQADIMRLALHEEAHGFSPITADVYDGAGVAIEEVGTELLARRSIRRINPVDGVGDPPGLAAGPNGQPVFTPGHGCYDAHMQNYFTALHRAGVPLQGMSTRVEEAYLHLRENPPRPLIKTSDEYARMIADRLGDDLTQEQKDAAYEELRNLPA